jgi:clan AA aspartic protease (TIGR02281 family)
MGIRWGTMRLHRKGIFLDAARLSPACEFHLDEAASATCSECLRHICAACSLLVCGDTLVCPACRGAVLGRRRRFTAAKLGIAVATIVLLVTMAARYHARDSEPIPVQAARVLPPTTEDLQIIRLREAVANEPCDRVRIVHLADKLLTNGDSREVLSAAARFFERCGDHPRLRWSTFEAHKRLGQWDASIAEATKLIADDRFDRDYWAWRGLVYETKGDFAGAISDYRQALSLEPRLAGIPFNLANLYERTGRGCEAIFPLEQFLHHHPAIEGASQVRQRIIGLYESGRCGDFAAKGRAVVAFGAGSKGIVATATVNKRHRGRFLIDTGASYVALSSTFARRIGLEAPEGSVLIQTANGPTTARPITLDAVAIQGASASRVSALVLDSLPEEIDGLLGLSFLSRFEMKLNRQRGRLELSSPNHGASDRAGD